MSKKKKNMLMDPLVLSYCPGVLVNLAYPTIYAWIITGINEKLISIESIVACIATFVITMVWNRYSKKLYRFYIPMIIMELIAYLVLAIFCLHIDSPTGYFIGDLIACSLISRSIVCGDNKLTSIIYTGEHREKYDNLTNVVSSVARLIGASIALLVKIPLGVALMINWVALVLCEVLHIIAYLKSK